jgi:S-adenosylmethionine:tRNA ribosyltransferase-isomerase
VRLDDFDYHLPKEMIAQEGLEPRDSARLMVMTANGRIDHLRMRDLPSVLDKGDTLVVNESRVIAARVRARKPTGGRAELVFLEPQDNGDWDCLVGGGNLKEGSHLIVGEGEAQARVDLVKALGPGRYSVRVEGETTPENVMDRWGEMPTPPYIHKRLEDPDRYQTAYARVEGSVAAPTAGLHFNDSLMEGLEAAGVSMVKLVLHVGYGTFQPVRVDQVEDHVMGSERLEVSAGVASAINDALDSERRVIAVGTTTVRALESATDGDGHVLPVSRPTDLFIYPGYSFRFPYSGLMTNFHLPRSTLLMLVAAYAGRERVMAAYAEAVAEAYRFYSLGDGMLISGGPV